MQTENRERKKENSDLMLYSTYSFHYVCDLPGEYYLPSMLLGQRTTSRQTIKATTDEKNHEPFFGAPTSPARERLEKKKKKMMIKTRQQRRDTTQPYARRSSEERRDQ